MKRNVDLKEISDGKLYMENDMAKVGCNDCAGCFACCTGMGESIILDPLDIYRLTCGPGLTIERLFAAHIKLHVVDGLTLPCLVMAGDDERCTFLNSEGRCSIHKYRPGVCRLFPLGRVYENGDFKYFLQTDECKSKVRTKVKVGKWIDVDRPRENRAFLNVWHNLLNELEEKCRKAEDLEEAKEINLKLLRTFYFMPYEKTADFYEQFERRLAAFSV